MNFNFWGSVCQSLSSPLKKNPMIGWGRSKAPVSPKKEVPPSSPSEAFFWFTESDNPLGYHWGRKRSSIGVPLSYGQGGGTPGAGRSHNGGRDRRGSRHVLQAGGLRPERHGFGCGGQRGGQDRGGRPLLSRSGERASADQKRAAGWCSQPTSPLPSTPSTLCEIMKVNVGVREEREKKDLPAGPSAMLGRGFQFPY